MDVALRVFAMHLRAGAHGSSGDLRCAFLAGALVTLAVVGVLLESRAAFTYSFSGGGGGGGGGSFASSAINHRGHRRAAAATKAAGTSVLDQARCSEVAQEVQTLEARLKELQAALLLRSPGHAQAAVSSSSDCAEHCCNKLPRSMAPAATGARARTAECGGNEGARMPAPLPNKFPSNVHWWESFGAKHVYSHRRSFKVRSHQDTSTHDHERPAHGVPL